MFLPRKFDILKRDLVIFAGSLMPAAAWAGINQGTSGNISLRHDDGVLITLTSVPYGQPEQVVMSMDGASVPAPSEHGSFISISRELGGQRRGSRPSALLDDPGDRGPADP